MEGTSGNERFYVMALVDIGRFGIPWYYNARNNLDSSYDVSVQSNDFAVAGVEPTGRINTERMIASWNSSQYGAQNTRDLWGLIQDEVEDGWFVPSKSEWAAFGAAFDITNSNYSTLGLNESYWTSSQYRADMDFVFYVDFYSGNLSWTDVRTYITNSGNKAYYTIARLATTF